MDCAASIAEFVMICADLCWLAVYSSYVRTRRASVVRDAWHAGTRIQQAPAADREQLYTTVKF